MCMMLDNIVLRPSRQPEHPSPSPCTARCLRQSSLGQVTVILLLETAGRLPIGSAVPVHGACT